MTGELIIVRATGGGFTTEFLAKPPELERLQKIVGGYIEEIPHFRFIKRNGGWQRCLALCNEEGKLRRPEPLPPNLMATQLWNEALSHQRPGLDSSPDYLVGNIAILIGDDAFMRALRDEEDDEGE